MGYSQSKLNTYRDCPLKYKYAYVDKIEVPSTIEQFLGSTVHEALEEVLKVRRDYHRDLSYEDACGIFDRRFDANYTADLTTKKGYLTPEDHKLRGHDFIAKFYEIEARRHAGEVLGVEKWISFPIGRSSMGGYVDRLERVGDELHIIDYKASDYPMKQEKADVDWQLPIYQMAVQEEFPEAERFLLEWFYLGAGVVVQSARTPEQLQDLKGEICSLIDEIESDTEFQPLGNNWCPCEYEELCKTEKERRRLKACAVVPPIDGVVAGYAQATVEKSQLKARLKELEIEMGALETRLVEVCQETGAWSVEGDGHMIEVNNKTDYAIPKKGSDPRLELEQMVRESGLWDQMSEIDKSAVLAGIKKQKFGELNDAIRAMFDEKMKHSFKVIER